MGAEVAISIAIARKSDPKCMVFACFAFGCPDEPNFASIPIILRFNAFLSHLSLLANLRGSGRSLSQRSIDVKFIALVAYWFHLHGYADGKYHQNDSTWSRAVLPNIAGAIYMGEG